MWANIAHPSRLLRLGVCATVVGALSCMGIVFGVRNHIPLLSTVSIVLNIMLTAAICFLPALAPARRKPPRPNADVTHMARLALAGRISASIVHEIIQPISAILLNIEALEVWFASKNSSAAIAESILSDLKREEQRTRETVLRLRRFFSKGELHSEPTNINELVANSIQLLRQDLKKNHIVVSTQLAPDALPALVDRVHLQQVLVTLIVNAIDAMTPVPIATRRLQIRTGQVADHSVEITIADSGPEMSQEQFEHAFDPFFTTKEEGMGLGLSVARSIVQAHRGLIWIERRSAGTSFHLEIPAARQG